MYEQATMFGRGTPPSIKAAARKQTVSPEQKRRQRFLDEERIKILRDLIAKHRGRRHFAAVSRWRKELIEIHERF
jgi:hypothetical protein